MKDGCNILTVKSQIAKYRNRDNILVIYEERINENVWYKCHDDKKIEDNWLFKTLKDKVLQSHPKIGHI